jgi:hypothetical protein
MNDMDPKQQKFPLILYPFAAAIWVVCAVQAALAHAGIIKPPPKEYENNWRGLPW